MEKVGENVEGMKEGMKEVMKEGKGVEEVAKAVSGIRELSKTTSNIKGLFDAGGLVKGLVRVGWKVVKENALQAITSISVESEERKKGLVNHEGLIALLVTVVGKEGEEWKVAREKAPMVIVYIADPPDVQLGLATHSNLLPNLLLFSTEDGSPSPECRKQ